MIVYFTIGIIWAAFCMLQSMLQYGLGTSDLDLLKYTIGSTINCVLWPASVALAIYKTRKGTLKTVFRPIEGDD